MTTTTPAPWYDGPLAVLDLETTGTDPTTDRIVEVALFEQVAPGAPIRTLVSELVDPGADVEIPPGASEVHGIDRAKLEDVGARPVAEVLPSVCAELSRLDAARVPLVIYNAPFDWPFLATELDRHTPGLACPDVPPFVLVDPLVLDRWVDRYRRGKRTLTATAGHYGLTVDTDRLHRADYDAELTLEVARAIGRTYPDELAVNGEALYALQVAAFRVWRESFNRYLDRVGADRDRVTGDWPGIDPPAETAPLPVLATCRGAAVGGTCRAPIRWVVYPSGKRAPIDPEPSPDGNVRLLGRYTPAGDEKAEVLGPLEVTIARGDGEPLYLPHHATCPDADRFGR